MGLAALAVPALTDDGTIGAHDYRSHHGIGGGMTSP